MKLLPRFEVIGAMPAIVLTAVTATEEIAVR
jgi:hypothetical protein